MCVRRPRKMNGGGSATTRISPKLRTFVFYFPFSLPVGYMSWASWQRLLQPSQPVTLTSKCRHLNLNRQNSVPWIVMSEKTALTNCGQAVPLIYAVITIVRVCGQQVSFTCFRVYGKVSSLQFYAPLPTGCRPPKA